MMVYFYLITNRPYNGRKGGGDGEKKHVEFS
jgi:hypothetical protein